VLWTVRGPARPRKTLEGALAHGFLVELTVPLIERQLLKAQDVALLSREELLREQAARYRGQHHS
jgi:hypothetical protein